MSPTGWLGCSNSDRRIKDHLHPLPHIDTCCTSDPKVQEAQHLHVARGCVVTLFCGPLCPCFLWKISIDSSLGMSSSGRPRHEVGATGSSTKEGDRTTPKYSPPPMNNFNSAQKIGKINVTKRRSITAHLMSNYLMSSADLEQRERINPMGSFRGFSTARKLRLPPYKPSSISIHQKI